MLRMAGTALKNVGKFIGNNAGSNSGEVFWRLAPDVGFGVLAGVQTPGDIGDKLIAGGTQAIGGSLGGIAMGGAARKLGVGGSGQTVADMFGSYGGDFAGMAIGDNLQRGKDVLMGGEGLTAWERLSAADQKAFAQQLEQQILTQYGIIPGTREQYAASPGLMVRPAPGTEVVYNDGSGVV